jgi:hypothetical protein
MHPIDLAVAALSACQFGVFSRLQVLDRGGNDALIQRRLRTGRWIQLAPGIYGLPGHPPSFRRDLWISWLASPHAVVTHWAGGHLRRLDGFPAERLTLSVAHGTSRSNPLAQVFQTRDIPATTMIDGLPVASVERILADVSPFVGGPMLEQLVERARVGGHTNPVRLRRELLRLTTSGRDLRRFRAQVEHYGDGPVPARSELEARLDRILGRIPAVAAHEAPLPGREWSAERVDRRFDLPRRLIVEGDGRRFHTRMADFRRDRERDRTALRHGYPTIRYAYEDLLDDPDGVEAEVRDILGIPEH